MQLQTALADSAAAGGPELYELAKPENILYTTCLQCNTGCGIKAKILDGVVVKIDGSPYSPWCLYPHLPYKSSPFETARVDGHLCPKGAAGIQTTYDPYRIRKVLKRAGRRGEMKWISIPFEQAVEEIVEGGKLFAAVSGEENREVAGLRSLRAMTEKAVLEAMAADVAAIKHGHMTVGEFKARHAPHLDLLIDPDHPDLGPKNNQLCFLFGRLKGGRSEFIKRFVLESFGSTNVHGHTTVCQGSLYFTGKAMSEQYVFDEKDQKVKWTGGDKFYWQGDLGEAEFVLFVGSAIWEGGYGPPLRTPRITEAISEGRLKIAVVDPRFSKLAAKAWRWVPAKNGSEGALALGIIQRVLALGRFHRPFLANANKAAAVADKEGTWSNATWLVKCEGKPKSGPNGQPLLDAEGRPVLDWKPGALLYGSDLGLPKLRQPHVKVVEKVKLGADGEPLLDDHGKVVTEKVAEPVLDKEGQPVYYELDRPMVLQNGKPVPFDPNDESEAVEGELFGEIRLSVRDKEGQPVEILAKTALRLLEESANEKTLDEWAELCGIETADLIELADEFSSHGRRAIADIHRGVSQHTNGYYNVHAWYSLNLLMGNFDHRGGLVKGSTWAFDGSKTGQPYPLGKLNPGKIGEFGLSIIRHNVKFEETTLFDKAKGSANYPAKRQWWPLSSDVYEEVLPSIADQYPYPIKILITYMAAPTYSLPGGQTNIAILQDLEKLPLYIANDITVGETSMYADYIFPDTSFLERWEFQGTHPTTSLKVQPIRQPVVAPIPEEVQVFGQAMPLCLESMLMAFAERLELRGWGKDGFAKGQDFVHFDQFYLRAVANIAAGEKPVATVGGKKKWLGAVAAASAEEQELFRTSRRHLPASVFDEERWKASVGADLWPAVVTVLNRGGRLEDFDKLYEGDLVKNRYGKQANLYCEKTAKAKNAITGKSYYGIARYVPISGIDGKPLDDEAQGYDLHLMTYREIMQTKSRTISNYYLNALRPENFLLMNARDAQARGLANGDLVRISSATNPEGIWPLGPTGDRPMVGKVKVIQGIRPGVVAFSLGHGHWAMGSQDLEIDGRHVPGDARRATGFHANAAMRLDPVLGNTCLLDPVGGSVSFYDTKIKVVRA